MADQLGRLRFVDVDVVTALRLRGRREDRLGETLGFAKACRQPDAADFAAWRRSLSSPSPTDIHARRIRSAAARSAVTSIDRPCSSSAADRAGIAGYVAGSVEQQVVGDDRSGPLEPECGDLRQDFSLVGNPGAEHVVERGNTIAGDDAADIAEIVDVADLALSIGPSVGERGLENGRGERQQILRREGPTSYRVRGWADNNNI